MKTSARSASLARRAPRASARTARSRSSACPASARACRSARTRPSRNSALLASQRPSLRSTVISAGWPRRARLDRAVVDPQVGVAVEHEEALAEVVAAPPAPRPRCPPAPAGRSGSAARARAPSRRRARASIRSPRYPTQSTTRCAPWRAQQRELVGEERLPGDLDQRLRRVADPLAQPGPEPAGQDADRAERHASMTVSTVTRSRSGALSRSIAVAGLEDEARPALDLVVDAPDVLAPSLPRLSSWMPLKKQIRITIVGLPVGNGKPRDLQPEVDERRAAPRTPRGSRRRSRSGAAGSARSRRSRSSRSPASRRSGCTCPRRTRAGRGRRAREVWRKPTSATSPRRKPCSSRSATTLSTTRRLISRKSPVLAGISTSEMRLITR